MHDISDLKLCSLCNETFQEAGLMFLISRSFNMPLNPFKANKICTVSTTTCMDKYSMMSHCQDNAKIGV